MNKIFILSGASGAGKSTLLSKLVSEGFCVTPTKYSSRNRYQYMVDEISHVNSIRELKQKCDITYTMYGNEYGFNSQELKRKLEINNQVIITNDIKTIERLKEMFVNQIVVIYIISDVNKRLLRQIFMKRYGPPSLSNGEKEIIGRNLGRMENALKNQECSDKLFIYLEKTNVLIDSISLKNREFSLRLDSIKQQEKYYEENLNLFDYIVLNFYSASFINAHASKSAYNQLKKIIQLEMREK